MSAAEQQKPEIKIKLTAVAGPHSGQVFSFSKSPLKIGRGPENDIVLMNDPQVSRVHAEISIVDRDLEVANLSQKNAIYVQGESVEKWKIVNNSTFTVGDTEFNVEYDLGQAVVSVAPQKPVAQIVPFKPKSKPKPVAKKAPILKPKPAQMPAVGPQSPALRQQQVGSVQNRNVGAVAGANFARSVSPQGFNPAGYQARPAPADASLMSNPNMKYYLIILIVIAAVASSLLDKDKKSVRNKQITSIVTYDDAKAMQQGSEREKAKMQELEDKRKDQNSAQALRTQENFMKGMRDFQLGNYSRAQDFFQLVLNLDPGNTLARRHYELSKIRFDELVQEKLMLGESYFKKHNFRMCESMYRQVIDMLEGKSNEQKLALAKKKATECKLADEGVF